MFETYKDSKNRLNDAIDKLLLLDWFHLGDWLFFKGGKVYDLSAANLDKLEVIEKEGLFIVAQ